MKARFTDNSIRLRLRKSDIATLKENGEVTMSIGFLPGPFHFTLRVDTQSKAMGAERYRDGIVIALPAKMGLEWMDTDRVGLEGTMPANNGEVLNILVEKDFPCAHRPMEDKSDTFHELG